MTLAALALAASLAPAPALAATPAAVVKSREWVVRRGEKREEEFKGEVRYESAGTRLTADWALFRHATRDWDAKGRVVLRRELADGSSLEARGERARHDEASGRGRLDPAPGGRVGFERSVADGAGPDRGEGDSLSWEGDRAAVLKGRARVWGPRLEVWSDEARWEASARRLRLDGGRPVLLRNEEGPKGYTVAVKADEISAFEKPRRIEARGKVRGWLQFRDESRLKELVR